MMHLPVYNSFFGLRDFIYFFTALNTTGQQIISPQSVVMALEQNFSGTKKFDEILKAFLEIVSLFFILLVNIKLNFLYLFFPFLDWF